MRTLLIITATALAGLLLPQTAEAGYSSCNTGYTYQSGRSSCGCPVYTRRVVAGYDCYNRPVYRYYSVPVVHRCRHTRSHSYTSHYTPSRHYGYSRSYSSRSNYHRGSYSRSSRSRGRSCR